MYNMQPQMEKSAQQVAFENAYWNTIVEKSAAMEQQATENLFNAAFAAQQEKLAALDPAYGEFLHQQEVKQAFDEQFYATCAQYGVTFQ